MKLSVTVDDWLLAWTAGFSIYEGVLVAYYALQGISPWLIIHLCLGIIQLSFFILTMHRVTKGE